MKKQFCVYVTIIISDYSVTHLTGLHSRTDLHGNEMDKSKRIKTEYFTPGAPTGYASLSGFLKNSKYKDKNLVQKTLQDLRTYSIHKNVRKTFPRRKVMVSFIDVYWTMDILVMLKYKHNNSHYGYVLVILDCFSRYYFLCPLKKKDADSVHLALSTLFKMTPRRPEKIWADRDLAWYNKKVQSLLAKYKIQLYSTFSKKKAVLSELGVKEVKKRLYKHMTHTGKKNWLSILPEVEQALNNTYSSAIGRKPNEVNEANSSEVWHRVYKKIVDMDPPVAKYAIGQLVRISREKLIFDKAYTQSYSDEIFSVYSIIYSRPVVSYRLADTKGNVLQSAAYEEELQPVNSVKNNDE